MSYNQFKSTNIHGIFQIKDYVGSPADISANMICDGTLTVNKNTTLANVYCNNSQYLKTTNSIIFSQNLGVIGGPSNNTLFRIAAENGNAYLDFNSSLNIRACDLSGNLLNKNFNFYSNGIMFCSTVGVTDLYYTGNINCNNQFFISTSELGCLDGISSNIQTQLNGKASLANANTFISNATFNSTVNILGTSNLKHTIVDSSFNVTGQSNLKNVIIDGSLNVYSNLIVDNTITANYLNVNIDLVSANIRCSTLAVEANIICGYPNPIASISYTELSFLDNVSSNIQTQLNSKASLSTTQTFTNSNTFNENTIFRKQIQLRATSGFQSNLSWSDSANNLLSLLIYNSNKQYFNILDTSSTGWLFMKTGTTVLTISETGLLTTSSGNITDLSCNMLQVNTGLILPPNSIYDVCLSSNVAFINSNNEFAGTTNSFYDISCNTIHLGSNLYVNSATISPTELSYLDGVTSNIQNQITALAGVSLSGNNVFTGNNTFNNIYSNNSHYFKGDGTQSIYFTSVLGVIGGAGNTAYTRFFATNTVSFIDFYNSFKLRACDLSGNTTGSVYEFNSNGLLTLPTISVNNLQVNTNLIADSISISPTELSYLDGVTSNIQTQLTALSGPAKLTSTQTFTGVNTFSNTIKSTNDIYLASNSGGFYSTPNALPATTGNVTYMRIFASSQNSYYDYGNLNLYFRPVEAHNGSQSISNKITFNQYANIDAPSITTPSLTVSSLLSAIDISCNTLSIAGSNVQTQIDGLIPKVYTFNTISAATTLGGGLVGKHFIVSGTSVFTITLPSATSDGYTYSFYISNTGAAYPNYITLFSPNGSFSGFTPSTQQSQTTSFKLYYRSHISVRANGTSWVVENGSFLDLYPNNLTNFGDTTLKGNLTAEGTITLPSASISDSALSSNIPKLNANNSFTGTTALQNTIKCTSSMFFEANGTVSIYSTPNALPATTGNTVYMRQFATGSNCYYDYGNADLLFRCVNAATGTVTGTNITFSNTGSITAPSISTPLLNVNTSISLPAASISDSALSSNVTLDNAANTFTAQNTFNSNVVTGTSSDIKSGRHIYMTSGNNIYYSNTNGTISGTTYLKITATGTNSFIDYGDGSCQFRPYDSATTSLTGTNIVFTKNGQINHYGLNGRNGSSGTTNGQFWNQYWTGTALQCWINTVNQGTFTLSDKRIKENFQPPSLCLERLCSIPMTNYEWKDTGIFKKNGLTHIGFFAQDIKTTFPELNAIVEGEPDELTSDGEIQPMRINPEFVNVLMKSIQELNEKVEKLSNRVIELESKISS